MTNEYLKDIARQRAGIIDKLAADEIQRKEGHVTKATPNGEGGSVPLGPNQVSNRQKELDKLTEILFED